MASLFYPSIPKWAVESQGLACDDLASVAFAEDFAGHLLTIHTSRSCARDTTLGVRIRHPSQIGEHFHQLEPGGCLAQRVSFVPSQWISNGRLNGKQPLELGVSGFHVSDAIAIPLRKRSSGEGSHLAWPRQSEDF
jgi:hypothetical protein